MERGSLPPLSLKPNVRPKTIQAKRASPTYPIRSVRTVGALLAAPQLATMSTRYKPVGAGLRPARLYKTAIHFVPQAINILCFELAGIMARGEIAGGAWGKFSARNLRLSN
jgi:hypothetical protein